MNETEAMTVAVEALRHRADELQDKLDYWWDAERLARSTKREKEEVAAARERIARWRAAAEVLEAAALRV